ncbi:MAG: nuclear transport factor 2 family protein [Gemmatimonadaceae bacterium]|nr:nuclear transport factor 2 family protein [Gemmatimonadaceae bacterium]
MTLPARDAAIDERETQREAMITTLYYSFNARDVDTLLGTMHRDITWPNGIDGGTVWGRDAVREYWERLWTMLDPKVRALGFAHDHDRDTVSVRVSQVMRNIAGEVQLERIVHHVFSFTDGRIARLEIRD